MMGIGMKRLAILASLLLAACSDNGAGDAPDTDAVTAGEAAIEIESRDFSELDLGAKIVGPVGDEVSGQFVVGGRVIGDIVSYVACPAPAESCDPTQQPDGALYTYVHRVTPVGVEGDDGVAPLGFRTTMAAEGFAGMIGFDRVQAAAALGETYTINITDPGGSLVWAIQSDDAWIDGEEMTFFWQSTQPPAGPAKAYAIETVAGDAIGTGPFPAQ